MTRWQELEEFPDYAVSDRGEITNIKTGMPRKFSMNQGGVLKISMYQGRELITRSLAVLVATAFVEGQTALFNTPIHLDGDRENCEASNLMWRPRWFAVAYHRQFYDRGFREELPPVSEITEGVDYASVQEACTTLGLLHSDVYQSYITDMPIPLTRHHFELM